eukprot:11191081-Lingulodinium_polyedra.AAC.1
MSAPQGPSAARCANGDPGRVVRLQSRVPDAWPGDPRFQVRHRRRAPRFKATGSPPRSSEHAQGL